MGIVSLSVQRSGTQIDLSLVQTSQLLGDEALWGATQFESTARANNDVTLMPIDLGTSLAAFKSAHPLGRALAQSLLEKHRRHSHALRELQLQADPTPCPEERITKLFAALYYSAEYTGKQKKPGKTTVVWPAFKRYNQRIFLESPVRLEQAVYILVRLGYAELEMVPCETDPDAPDELGFVHFTNLEIVRSFVEFHRNLMAATAEPEEIDPAHQAILQLIEEWNAKGKVWLQPSEEPNAAA
jgi:hypothetical protein